MQYLVIFMGFLILVLSGECAYLLSKNAELKTLSEINNALLDSQTQAIEEMELESQKYHCDLESMNEYTKEKYSTIIIEHKDESCESKLKAFEKALNIYESR